MQASTTTSQPSSNSRTQPARVNSTISSPGTGRLITDTRLDAPAGTVTRSPSTWRVEPETSIDRVLVLAESDGRRESLLDFLRASQLSLPAFDTLEESLLGAGVPTSSLYPLDLARAFASLDKIKPNVDVWWNSGAQATQLLASGEVDMIATWASRPQQAIMDGAPVAIVWNQNLWGVDNWAILAGTPNADACREFIKFASDVKRMAQQGDFYPAGVTQPEAFKYMKPESARHSPTHPDNIKSGVQINAKYWLDNQVAVTERFNAWVLK